MRKKIYRSDCSRQERKEALEVLDGKIVQPPNIGKEVERQLKEAGIDK